MRGGWSNEIKCKLHGAEGGDMHKVAQPKREIWLELDVAGCAPAYPLPGSAQEDLGLQPVGCFSLLLLRLSISANHTFGSVMGIFPAP